MFLAVVSGCLNARFVFDALALEMAAQIVMSPLVALRILSGFSVEFA